MSAGGGPGPGLLPQFIRFVTVGVTNSIVDFGVFNLLLVLVPSRNLEVLVLFNSIAVGLAIVNSYLWNTRWTFHAAATDEGLPRRRQGLLFLAQALVNVGVNDLVVALLTRLLVHQTFLSQGTSSNVAKLVAMLVASLSSFVMLKYVVYAEPAGM